jgi:uroporphyrinogen decarboxylase
MFSDILTPLPALGIEFDVIKGKGPAIPVPIRSMEQVTALRPMADPDTQLPFVRPVLQALRAEVGAASTVLGFIGTPWTLAAYSVEGGAEKSCTRTKAMMTHAPLVLHALLAHLADALVVYACHQIDAGAQVVQLFDSWAHHLSPDQFREFSLPYAERVLAGVRARHPHVPLIFHANGSAGKERAMSACTADVLGLDWGTDMRDARALLGPTAVLQGNVDPQLLFGPEEVIRAAVRDCVAAAGRHHILNVGHGVAQGTPEASVALFCELARAARYD